MLRSGLEISEKIVVEIRLYKLAVNMVEKIKHCKFVFVGFLYGGIHCTAYTVSVQISGKNDLRTVIYLVLVSIPLLFGFEKAESVICLLVAQLTILVLGETGKKPLEYLFDQISEVNKQNVHCTRSRVYIMISLFRTIKFLILRHQIFVVNYCLSRNILADTQKLHWFWLSHPTSFLVYEFQ